MPQRDASKGDLISVFQIAGPKSHRQDRQQPKSVLKCDKGNVLHRTVVDDDDDVNVGNGKL